MVGITREYGCLSAAEESWSMKKAHPETQTALEYVWQNPWVRATTWVILGAVIITLLVLLYPRYSFVLWVFLVGFFLAYLLNPLVMRMRRWRIPRAIAVIIVFLILIGIGVLGSLLVAQVFAQLGTFIQEVPQAVQQATSTFSNIGAWFGSLLSGFQNFLAGQIGFGSADEFTQVLQTQVASILTDAATGFTELMQNLVSGGTGAIVGGAASIISGTAQAIITMLATAYFLWDYPRITANFYRMVPVRYRPIYNDMSSKADKAVGGYIRGQLIITVCMGLLVWIGLAIIGVPLSLAIGFLVGVFNLVPYLGPIIGAVPAVLLALTVSPLTALLAIGVIVVANQLESNLLSPLILSRSVNIHPLTVMLAIIAGLSLFGLVGALLAVPAVSLIKLVLEDYVLTGPAYQQGPFRRRKLADSAAPVVVEDEETA